MNNAWLVRPFPHDKKRLHEFQNQNIVAIGWPGIGDLSGKSREELKAILSEPPYSLKGLALGNAYATVDILVNSMQIGDLVLVADGADIYFGKITSDYIFNPDVDNDQDGYPHQRNVKWLSSTSRKELSKPLRSSLKVHRTTADLTKHYNEIKSRSLGEDYIIDDTSSNNIKVSYPLRADFTISFEIPSDITKTEAKRLSQYIYSLYFNE